MKFLVTGILVVVGLGFIGIVDEGKYRDIYPKKGVGEEFRWEENENYLSLQKNGNVIWRLNFDKNEDKPYFYPLRTSNGIDLALERPEDHPWHRGLWFSWKYINGVNYWEEDPQLGLAEGRSLIKNVEIKKADDYSAKVQFLVHYAPGENQTPLLLEERTLNISSPDEDGNYYIDWHHLFSANDTDITLDRTPPSKHIWGGYAGISFRASMDDLTSFRFLDSNEWKRNESLTGYGKDARWMDLSGEVIDKKSSIDFAGVAIFDHPNNPRHPSSWYVWYENQGKGENYKHAFFTPAFLYNKPYNLEAGESFTLKYRTFIHTGKGEFEELNNQYQAYIKQ